MPPLDNPTDVYIPNAVRRQAARAEELARENGIAGAPVLEELPAEPVEPEPAPEPAPEPVEPEPAPEPTVDYEQQYRTLQGKYNAEVPELRRQLDSMRTLVAQMHAPRPEPEARPVTTTTVVPPEHVETFGQDLIDAARQWARAEISPELEQLRQEMNSLRGGQHRVETNVAQTQVEAHLSADETLASRWRALNEDPGFIAWLNQADPYTGRPRMAAFSDACERGEGTRVARFFKGYIAEHTALNQPSPTLQPQTPAEQVAGRPSLEEMAAPGRAAGTGPSHSGAPAEKRLWTQPQIARFYDDRRRNRYAGREAEADALERDILAAASEGRIR